MEYWQRNEDGTRFDNEEDAYLDYLSNEDDAALEDYLRDLGPLTFDDLLHWAMGEDAFWEHFQDEITEARESLFEDFYSHWDEPDEDDDEIDELITEMEQRSETRPKKQYAVDAWGDLYDVNPTE
jgi:hypothetical protein